MKIETNKLMDKRLKGESVEEWMVKYPLTTKLKNILKAGLSEINGMIFLSTFCEGFTSKDVTDKNGTEMLINKFHVEDYIPKKNIDYSLQQGIVFAFKIQDLLVNRFPGAAFKIIVSTDEGEDSFPGICTLGFYKIRPKDVVWLQDDLEKYQMNGLMVIIT